MSNEFLARKSRFSIKTSAIYATAISEWVKSNNAKNGEHLVHLIKAGKVDVYATLDKFISYLHKRGKAPKTILLHSFLKYLSLSTISTFKPYPAPVV